MVKNLKLYNGKELTPFYVRKLKAYK